MIEVFLTEAGYVVLKEGKPIAGSREIDGVIQYLVNEEEILVSESSVMDELGEKGISSELMGQEEVKELMQRKLELIVSSGLAKNEEEAFQIIRERSIKQAEELIRETSSRPDLHIANAIQALDELDKYTNIVSSRVREWYGVHFPELLDLVQDNSSFLSIVYSLGSRENFSKEELTKRGIPERRAEVIVEASLSSKGGQLSEKDISMIREVANIGIITAKVRDKLASYVDSLMQKIAPNLREILGPTIGARLIAKAGSLEKLASLPASTIQILGAEKALFRALRRGGKPPKHGIIFQHEYIHSSPKELRGKIARALANKVAIAARVDFYSGEMNREISESLRKAIERIRSEKSKDRKRRR